MNVARGPALPITEEGSNMMGHQPDTSIDSGDFRIVRKKPPKKAAPTPQANRLATVTASGAVATIAMESSDDQDNFGSRLSQREEERYLNF